MFSLSSVSNLHSEGEEGGGGVRKGCGGGGLVIHAHMCLPVPPVTGPGGGAHDKLPSTGTLRAQPP